MINYDDYYNTISPQYNNIRLDAKQDFERTVSIIIANCPPNGRILDIGCGTGKYGEALAERGYVVKGVDKSSSQIDEAKEIIDAQVANADNLPFSSNSFDVCLMILMIHQLDQETRINAINEALRVLKSKGKLIIKTASHDDIKKRISSTYFPSACNEDLHRYPDIKTLSDELSDFDQILVQHEQIEVEHDTRAFANKLLKRRTSNLRNLSERELKEGVKRFLADHYGKESFKRWTNSTFLIARKK